MQLTNHKISLRGRRHDLSKSEKQLEVLSKQENGIPIFQSKLKQQNFDPLTPGKIEILQVNLGKMCNQTCKHCHVDAGPDRKEIMTIETMEAVVATAKNGNISTIDLTGGAPEMNPNFKWLVEEVSDLGKKIIVRCNLTIILSNPKFHYLPQFYADHNINVVSSLPHFSALRTDAQRGEGVFSQSIRALKLLNEVGYGKSDSELQLDLVFNPSGAFLPPDQSSLERDFKTRLLKDYGISFNNLFAITNMPISRFLDYLISSGNYDSYMEKLVNAYNPGTIEGLMCRNTISVGWDGALYDCDFNQMLELDVEVDEGAKNIMKFDYDLLSNRSIVVNQHCFGCTAGAGSSCGGEIV